MADDPVWQSQTLFSQSINIATDDVLSRDVSDTTDDATHGTVKRLPWDGPLAMVGLTPGWRLSFETGVPFSTSDQTAKSVLYYTRHEHDFVRLWDGTRPKLHQLPSTDISLSLTMTSGKNYDVFLWDDSGTLAMELSAAWTNDTTRADALAWQSGIGWVKSGSPTRLHLGALRASATNQSGICFGGQDVEPYCFLSNRYNRGEARFRWSDSANSWTYSSSTPQQAGANTKAKFSFVACVDGIPVDGNTQIHIGGAGNGGPTFGYDSTSSIYWHVTQSNAVALSTPCVAKVNTTLGYHYLAVLDWSSSGSVTFYGDAGTSFKYSGTFWDWKY